jgi:hypothetical protein
LLPAENKVRAKPFKAATNCQSDACARPAPSGIFRLGFPDLQTLTPAQKASRAELADL